MSPDTILVNESEEAIVTCHDINTRTSGSGLDSNWRSSSYVSGDNC